jgi:Tol biopolymer transport system component
MSAGGSNGIYLLSPDGQSAARLHTLEGAAAIAWSPEGERLAYIDGRPSPTGGLVGKLWVTGRRDGRVRLLSERAAAFFWSPDGTRLLFLEPFVIQADEASVFLYRMRLYQTFDDDTDTLGSYRPTAEFVRQIVPFFDQYHRAYEVWSPDSRLVAINAVAENGTPVVHLVDTELRRTGDALSVGYSVQVQASATGGFLPSEGVSSRIIGLGTVPFFSAAARPLRGTEL